jgi:hypothetical protein
VTGALAVSLVFFAAGCGKPPLSPEANPAKGTQPAPLANTGKVTVHVKDMTKTLNLV